jgi:DNA-binding MarR family transcriptional regulator
LEESNTNLDAARVLRAAIAKLNRRLRAHSASAGVGSTGLSLLGRLLRAGPSTAAELAAGEGLQPQSLTRALQSLEERGLIARTADAADKRRSIISILPPGVAVLRDNVRGREAWLAEAISATLSRNERDMLQIAASLIERVAEHDE